MKKGKIKAGGKISLRKFSSLHKGVKKEEFPKVIRVKDFFRAAELYEDLMKEEK